MHLLADRIVFFAEGDQFGELAFGLPVLVAQGQHLALGQRHGPATMRMGQEDLRHQVGILLEEAGVVFQVVRDIFREQRAHSSTSPVNTVAAGPVISTGRSAPPQTMVRSPPRVVTRTGESSRPRRMPVTTAAQAPVPQASVSPAPRS